MKAFQEMECETEEVEEAMVSLWKMMEREDQEEMGQGQEEEEVLRQWKQVMVEELSRMKGAEQKGDGEKGIPGYQRGIMGTIRQGEVGQPENSFRVPKYTLHLPVCGGVRDGCFEWWQRFKEQADLCGFGALDMRAAMPI